MYEGLELAGAVYGYFAELVRLEPGGLGGCLLLAANDNEAGEAGASQRDLLVRAANIAGAASLLPVAEEERGRALVRTGVCDFLVHGLDEALRIAKNEVRRKQAVAVAVLAEPRRLVEECVERGVQPDLLDAPAAALEQRGACLVVAPAAASRASPSQMVGWSLPPAARRHFPAIDALALAAMSGSKDAARRLWLQRAPQYMGRPLAGTHTVPMLEGELVRFRALLATGTEAPTAVEVSALTMKSYSCATE